MKLDRLKQLATDDRDGHPCWPGEFGSMAVTLGEAEFLYALVRAMRPERVLELGTGYGVSARFIAEALNDNGSGVLWTFEADTEYRGRAHKLLADVPAASVQFSRPQNHDRVDLVYIDSGYGYRAGDIRAWLTLASWRPLVVVHDGARNYEEFSLGTGVLVPSQAGFWIGRGK